MTDSESPKVTYLSPDGAIEPPGTWSVASRAGNYLFVAGMRGIDPATNKLVDGDEARIRQSFENMRHIAASEGASLQCAVRLTVYVTEMDKHRALCNQVQEELWEGGPYPPRTILEVSNLATGDVFEVEGTFYLGD